MKNSILIILLLVSSTDIIHAQNEITLKKTKYFKIADQPYQRIGSMGNELEPYIKNDKEAYEEFQYYKSIKTGAFLTGSIAVAGGVLVLVGFSQEMEAFSQEMDDFFGGGGSPGPDPPDGTKEMEIGAALLLGGSMATLIFNLMAKEKLKKSVSIYNQNLTKDTSSFLQKIKPDKLGIIPVNSGHGFQIGLSWTIE